MNRYEDSVKIFTQLEEAVSNMSKAKTREEVEKLAIEARTCFKSLMMKLPFVENDIHQIALKETERIVKDSVNNIVSK